MQREEPHVTQQRILSSRGSQHQEGMEVKGWGWGWRKKGKGDGEGRGRGGKYRALSLSLKVCYLKDVADRLCDVRLRHGDGKAERVLDGQGARLWLKRRCANKKGRVEGWQVQRALGVVNVKGHLEGAWRVLVAKGRVLHSEGTAVHTGARHQPCRGKANGRHTTPGICHKRKEKRGRGGCSKRIRK